MNFTSVFEELNSLYEDKVEETPVEEVADEVVEDDIVAEEPAAEEPAADEEPKQVILECAKCGALVIMDEADVAIDEETDLANVDEACQYCEEAEGYKIIGAVVPYATEEPVEEQLSNEDAKDADDANDTTEDDEDADLDEGIFDFGKKKREAEQKRKEDEAAAREAEQEKSKRKWPTAADYDAYEKEQQEQRRIDAEMAKYKAMGKDWNKRNDSSSPSNTPYAGVNYSGGDYF